MDNREESKVALVSGANTGVGFQIAKACKKRIHCLCRFT